MSKPNKISKAEIEQQHEIYIKEKEQQDEMIKKERIGDFWRSQNTLNDGAKHLATLISLLQGLLIAAIAFGNIQELLKGFALFSFVFSLLLLTMSLISSALVFIPQKHKVNNGRNTYSFIDASIIRIVNSRANWLSRGYILFMFASITVMATLMFLVLQPIKSAEPIKIIIMTPTYVSTPTLTLSPILATETLTLTASPIVSVTATP